MGYKHVKQLESVEYNRKLFYLDRGAIDLPPITDFTSIAPGSECRSLTTGEKWVLNTKYRWVYIGSGDCCCTGGSGSGNNGGSGSGDGDVPVPGEEPTINGVTIAPQNITVGLGASISFMAKIEGSNKLNQGITWSVKGQNSVDTKITNDGILTIAENERNKTITVRATSQGDISKYAQAVVTVDPELEEPLVEQITGVTISPRKIEVIRGRSALFSAQVTGANVKNRQIEWSISGHTSGNTTIAENGLLKIATDELSKLIIIKAVSAANPDVLDSTTVTTVIEADAENPAAITGVEIVPTDVEIGVGMSTKFAAVIRGELNPPTDVVWEMKGATDSATRITANGLLTVGENEKPGLLTVEVTSVFAPEFFAEADVIVISKEDPRYPDIVAKKIVTAVIVTPDSVEVPENTLKIFSAVVIGNNDPSQVVTWSLTGATVQTTYVTDQGVVIVGRGETAKILELRATSVQDPTKTGMAYIKVTQPTFEPTSGIEDVPKAPLGARYVRQRLANGETAWVILPEEVEEGPVGPDPEVRDIDINPEAVTVAPGSVITYEATVDTIGGLSDEVIWSIKGNDSKNTHITLDGTLYIGDDETSKLITVRATSVADETKYGRATVAVDKEAQLVTLVTGIRLIPNSADVIRGRAMKFQTVVTGVNLVNTRVHFSVTGNNSILTIIDSNGVLRVDEGESASVLIVTATADADRAKTATCVVAVIPEQLVEDVWEIHNVKVLPVDGIIGQTKTLRLACVISGINNPPQDVIWSVRGGVDVETHISRDGVLFCGDEETINRRLFVIATSVYDPDKQGQAIITVVGKDDPRVEGPSVDMVLVSPETIEAKRNEKITFSATVVGQNNPFQSVTWTIAGHRSAKTLISNLGVLTIGDDETAKAITVTAKSTFNPAKFGMGFVTVSEQSATDPKTGIPDVPEAPLDTDYVRRRDKSGKAIWVKVEDAELLPPETAGHGGYLGTFSSKRDLDRFTIPEEANEGDYAIVINDETHQNFPAIYSLKNGRLVFDVVLGRPFILGDKLDILYVLDNEVHSNLLRNVQTLDDFDTNDVRWELHESDAAWKLVTELHKGFWNMIKHNPDRYKAIVGMNRHTGEVNVYLTCFTDDREFIIPIYIENVPNPRPIDSNLRWTNTIAQGNTFTAANDTEFIQYKFDPTNFSLSIAVQNEIPPETDPGVSPWATVVGVYTLLKNGEVIGPLAGVTDPTGYLWVSNRESFMIGSAGDGTQMFCYSIDTGKSFIFDVPEGAKDGYQMACDLNERYVMMFISETQAVWLDRVTEQVKQITWRPTGYTGLSTPTPLTRPSISIDGKYYLHTSTNNTTPNFTTFSFETGNLVTESPTRGTSSSAIGLSDGQRVATNTPEGEISIYTINELGQMERIYNATPYEARYVVTPTGFGNNLLFVKLSEASGCPAWFVFDCDTQQITSESQFTERYCAQTNPQGKGCSYIADSTLGPRYLLTFANETDKGLIIERDMEQHGVWHEYELPFGGLGNDKHNYNQPSIMNDGTVLITTDSNGNPRGYDMVNHTEVDLSDLPASPSTDGDNNLVQIDDNHIAWCTHEGIVVYRTDESGGRAEIIKIPEQQGIVLGFGPTGR